MTNFVQLILAVSFEKIDQSGSKVKRITITSYKPGCQRLVLAHLANFFPRIKMPHNATYTAILITVL